MAKQGTKTTIAEANVVITGDVSGVARATKQAEQQVERSAKKIKKDLNDAVKIEHGAGAYQTTGAYELAGGVPQKKYSRQAVESRYSPSDDAAFNKRLSRIKARRLKRRLRGYNSPTGVSQRVGRLRGDVGKAILPVAIATSIAQLVKHLGDMTLEASALREELSKSRVEAGKQFAALGQRDLGELGNALRAIDEKLSVSLDASQDRVIAAMKEDANRLNSVGGLVTNAYRKIRGIPDSQTVAEGEEFQTEDSARASAKQAKQRVTREFIDQETRKFFADIRTNTQETANQIKQQASRGRR